MRPSMATQFKIPNYTPVPYTTTLSTALFSLHISYHYITWYFSLIYHHFPHWNKDPQGVLSIATSYPKQLPLIHSRHSININRMDKCILLELNYTSRLLTSTIFFSSSLRLFSSLARFFFLKSKALWDLVLTRWASARASSKDRSIPPISYNQMHPVQSMYLKICSWCPFLV